MRPSLSQHSQDSQTETKAEGLPLGRVRQGEVTRVCALGIDPVDEDAALAVRVH